MARWNPVSPEYVTDERGCWVWQGSLTDSGYGLRFTKGRPVKAHRSYYENHKGPIPEGLQLDHTCRNRACVNPDHLEAVTPAENVRRGKCAKLTHGDVASIRRRLTEGESQRSLAREYGVRHQAISYIRRGRTWASQEATR